MSSATSTPVAERRYIEALNEGMATAIEEDERVIVLGIDVGAGGGIFRVTNGLFERFGPERVIDTPIAEMGYVGAAVGAAMTGLRPIVEIMFMDFVGVCLDPILNQAAKLRYMTAGALEIPVVFRMQTGAGKAAGAQHSQSLEAWFAHVPGLKVVLPATVADARDLLLASVRDPNPVVFVENRRLYGTQGRHRRRPAAARQGPRRPRGRRRHRRHLGPDAAGLPRRRRGRRRLARGDRPALAGAARHGHDLRLGAEDRPAPDRPRGGHDFGAGAEIAARVGDRALRRIANAGQADRYPVGTDAVQPGPGEVVVANLQSRFSRSRSPRAEG